MKRNNTVRLYSWHKLDFCQHGDYLNINHKVKKSDICPNPWIELNILYTKINSEMTLRLSNEIYIVDGRKYILYWAPLLHDSIQYRIISCVPH